MPGASGVGRGVGTPKQDQNKGTRSSGEDKSRAGQKPSEAPHLEICGHCQDKVRDKGKGSDGIKCDWCKFWVHTKCEGMTSQEYDDVVVTWSK